VGASESEVADESKADGNDKPEDASYDKAISEEKKSEGAINDNKAADVKSEATGDEKASGQNDALVEGKPVVETSGAVQTPALGATGKTQQKEVDGSDQKSEPVASVSNEKCPPTEEKLPSSRKRDVDGHAVPSETTSSSSDNKVDRNGKPIRILDDDTEEIDCEFFNTRQCFLDLCRGNHYQFDELRRAKHTSMMVLWHLQNREAPKFVQQCFACAREISSGYRHHCNTCPDFDLCTECYRDPSSNRGQCTHKLEAIRVDNQGTSSGLTEEQRRERERNIQLHITLIEHASRCTSTTCKSSNCQKMKSYLKHGLVCTVKASGGCKLCKRIWTLLRIHAQQCKSNACPIPQCIAIRKRIRQLQQKQQAMDDRRRQEMNRHYRMGVSGN